MLYFYQLRTLDFSVVHQELSQKTPLPLHNKSVNTLIFVETLFRKIPSPHGADKKTR